MPFCKNVNVFPKLLKVQSCKFYSNKYMIASTEITNTETFAFIAVLVKLSNHEVNQITFSIVGGIITQKKLHIYYMFSCSVNGMTCAFFCNIKQLTKLYKTLCSQTGFWKVKKITLLKACVHFFLTYFCFSPSDNPSKNYDRCCLFRLKSFFRFWVIQLFVFPFSPVFLLASHCFRAWSKINLNSLWCHELSK